MSQRRTISKYPNRRLYDPAQGRYITLEDIRALVTGHVEFVVIDKKTGADITCSVLVQVVACEEKGAHSLLGRDFLLDLIRTHSGPEQIAVGAYLERALTVFVKDTELLQQHNVSDTAAGEPLVGGPAVTGVPAAVL